jgi:hypothetical protein
MLTALLLAMTSLVALLALMSSSKASPALQVTVTITELVAPLELLLAKAGQVFLVVLLSVLLRITSESTTGNADSAAACKDQPGGTASNIEILTTLNTRVITHPSEGNSNNHGNNIVDTESNQPEVYRPGNESWDGAPSTAKGPSIPSTFTCMLVILVGSL